ncbi:MAG: TolC family outer membrane protein [Gammaproteobacteria bacterium]|nr:TolC family outer membrane protein [Gammaproteobacteria bacterium]
MHIRNFCYAANLVALATIANVTSAADLSEVYSLAQRNDAQFRAETASYYAARQQKPIARSALLPQINGSAEKGDSSSKGSQLFDANGDGFRETAISVPGVDTETTQWNVNLRQSVYNHAYWKRMQQASALVAQAEAQYEANKQALILRTAETYFNVLAAEDNLTFAEAETKAVGQQLEQAKQRFEVGLIAITDVKESQAEYDNAVASEIEARNQLDSYREALWTLTNTNIPKLAKLGDNLALQAPEPQDKQQWVDQALANNLNLLATQSAYQAAKKEVAAQRAGHYPSLDLVASRSYNESDTGPISAGALGILDSDPTDNTTDYVGIQLTVPIFSGGHVSSSTKRAIYQRDAAEEQLELTRRATVQQTRNAYQNVLADISRVKALKQALISSQAAYEATNAGFEVGTRNSVEVLLSLRNTFRAERDYAATRYNYLLNTLRLKQAVGNLQVNDLQIINNWLK